MQVLKSFGSLSEFLDFAESETDFPKNRMSSLSGDKSFTGTANYAEAEVLAFGWKAGAAKIEKMAARIKPRNQKNRFEAVTKEAGPGVISMGAFNAGHPKPYVVLQESNEVKSGKGKIVKIQVNFSASASVNKDAIIRRGAAVLSLVSALEKGGRRCEIEALMVIGGGGWNDKTNSKMVMKVAIKKASQKLNLNTLAFALAHPSMLRRIGFAAMERTTDAERKCFGVGGGYGTPADCKPDAGAIYLQAMKGWDRVWESDGGAEAWIIAQAEAQGVKF